MAEVFETVGHVKGGRLDLDRDDIKALNAAIAPWEGKPVQVTVRRARATRSQQSNRYYWAGVLKTLSVHTGHTPEELHDFMKARFLPKETAFWDGNGEVVDSLVIGGSTTVLNSKEMADYIAAIKAWALEKLNCRIPEPNEAWQNQ
jgi:hypothetical protein